MKTIVLVRHGRIVWRFLTLIPGYGLDAWRRGEDAAPLDTSYRPPPGAELERLVRTAASLHASSLRRSIESARLLAPAVEPLIDARFREAELPAAIRSGVRLPAKVWAGVARARWFAGWGGTDGVESFREARSRAASAAAILEQHAESRGTVVLVGHGLMNILIAGHLRAAGWRGPRLPSQRHWGFDIYDGERLTTRSA